MPEFFEFEIEFINDIIGHDENGQNNMILIHKGHKATITEDTFNEIQTGYTQFINRIIEGNLIQGEWNFKNIKVISSVGYEWDFEKRDYAESV